jgi:hypothetical protein
MTPLRSFSGLAAVLLVAASLVSARATLIHRYSFTDGAKDGAGSVDGRLLGAGATITGGELVLLNERPAYGDKVACLEFVGSVLPAGGTSVSLAVWFTAKNTGGFARVLNFGDSEGTEGRQFIYLTPCTEEGMARVAITATDASAKTYIDFDALDDGRPHLVVVVVDGAAKSLRVFVDGKEPRPAQPLDGNTLDKVRPVQNWIGRSSFAADPGLSAAITEFRVYDQALTLAEAAALHQAGPDVLPVPAATAPDVTGTWDIEVITPAGPGRPVFTFKREGEKLSGHYRGAFGEAPVTVTLSGTEIRFAVKVKAGNQEATIEYAGTVEGTAMKGRVRIGTFTEGTFTGTKQAK